MKIEGKAHENSSARFKELVLVATDFQEERLLGMIAKIVMEGGAITVEREGAQPFQFQYNKAE